MDMKKQFQFKQGFGNGRNGSASLTMKLSVLTENMENRDVFRLIAALDNEYEQLAGEKRGREERKGFKKWQMVFG